MANTSRPYVSLDTIKNQLEEDYSSRVIHERHGAQPPYKMVVDPLSLDFGNIVMGQFSARQTITIRNVGYLPLPIVDIISVGDFIASYSFNPVLLPGSAFEIDVVFRPSSFGSRSGGIFINTGDVIGSNFVEFNGNGLPLPVEGEAPSVNITVDGENLS